MGKSPRRIVKIGPEDTIAAAARKMSRHGIGCLVVTDPFGKLVGILSERDIISRVLSRPKSSTRRRV
jgi:CBS domain-containing protein